MRRRRHVIKLLSFQICFIYFSMKILCVKPRLTIFQSHIQHPSTLRFFDSSHILKTSLTTGVIVLTMLTCSFSAAIIYQLDHLNYTAEGNENIVRFAS